MIGFLIIVLLIVMIYAYATVLGRAKSGTITIYSDVADFAWCCVTPVGLLVGGGLASCIGSTHSTEGSCMAFFGLALLIVGVIGFYHLVTGAFKQNGSMADAYWALLGRLLGSFLALSLIGLIFNEEGEDSHGRPNIVIYLIRIFFYVWLFKICVVPLIADNRTEVIAQNDGVFPNAKKKIYLTFAAIAVIVVLLAVIPESNWVDFLEHGLSKFIAGCVVIAVWWFIRKKNANCKSAEASEEDTIQNDSSDTEPEDNQDGDEDSDSETALSKDEESDGDDALSEDEDDNTDEDEGEDENDDDNEDENIGEDERVNFCNRCGAGVFDAKAKFCFRCGHRLE